MRVIQLSKKDSWDAVAKGKERFEESVANNRKDTNSRNQVQSHILGAAGERAAAIALGYVDVELTVNTFKEVPDLPGNIEVRTRRPELRALFRPKRKTDADVAEKIMGWKLVDGPSKRMDKAFQSNYWKHVNENTEMLTPAHYFIEGIPARVPRYSSSMRHAMVMVEYITKHKIFGNKWLQLHQMMDGHWLASWEFNYDDPGRNYAIHEKPAMAICLCALKTLNSED